MRAFICSGFEYHLHEASQYGFFRSFGFLWRLDASHNLVPIFYDNQLSQVWESADGTAYFKCDDEYFVFDGLQIVPVSGDPFSSEDVHQERFGSYIYTYDGSDYPRVNHHFEKIENGSIFEHKERSLQFLECSDDNFYFFSRIAKSIIKIDTEHRISDVFVASAEKVAIERVDYIVFIFRKNPFDKGVIEVYDLRALKVIDTFVCEGDGASGMYLVSQAEGKIFFTCGDRLMVWDGHYLSAPFPDRKIISYRATHSGVYISFVGDDALYFYDSDLNNLKWQRPTPVPGFCFDSLKGSDGRNFAELRNPARNMIAGLSYLVCWSDAESLNPQPWVCDVEKPIFSFKEQPSNGGFSLVISISAAEEYSVAARQAIAALDQGIYSHGAFMGRPHSSDFSGKIELHFEHSHALTAAQRHQLEEATERMLTDKYAMFTGAAEGKDCSLLVKFTD